MITAAAVVALVCMAACSTASYPVNAPLGSIDGGRGYRVKRFFAQDPDDRLFVYVSFSGGGKRAAALGFGVLEALRDTQVTWEGRERRLIDEIDLVMGLSGGSMLAAALALDGPAFMPAFEERFLHAPLQDGLVSRVFSPRNLWRMGSPTFGRGDVLAEYLDDVLFRGATFGDLSRKRQKPFAVIYASDMVSGGRFEFTQDQFDFLCSDLDSFPLARAVAASSSVPMLLSPVSLWNHAPRPGQTGCGEPVLRGIMSAAQPSAQALQRSAELESYRATQGDGLRRPYVHLLDGGLADNVGARGPLEFIGQWGNVVRGSGDLGYRGIRRSVFIVVNAETSAQSPDDLSPHVPGPLRTALAMADIPINRNSELSLAQMRATIGRWEAEVRAAHAQGDFKVFAEDARFYLVEVNFSNGGDAPTRERLRGVPTTLQLGRTDVEALREHGRGALLASPEFERFLRELE